MYDTPKLKIVNRLCNIPALRNWIPDQPYLEWQWAHGGGQPFDWNNPQTVNQKMQWLKLHDHNPLHTTFVDKYRAKIWLTEQFGPKHVIKTLSVYNHSSEIDLDKLPKSFVLKCNHDCGSVYLCFDKQSGEFYDKHMHVLSFEEVCRRLDAALKINCYYEAREWPYKHVKPCIFAEELLLQKDGTMPNDYKVFFIGEEPQFVYVSYDRQGADDRCTYDINWKRLPFVWVGLSVYNDKINTSDVPRPESLDDMLKYGAEVAKYFKCVRMDFFDVDGKMYFGEITPFHSGGYSKFYPAEYDLIYGQKIKLK